MFLIPLLASPARGGIHIVFVGTGLDLSLKNILLSPPDIGGGIFKKRADT